MKRIKAVAMFSGGLDSILAVKIMLEQRVDVYPIVFITPFSSSIKQGSKIEAFEVCKRMKIPLKVKFLGKEFIELVKSPLYGYGKNMNPCIDCRILMLKKARDYMKKIDAEFIITGEVLRERPMTQSKQTMKFTEEKSGLKGRIIRPLSAKLLESTVPEQKGWINRETLCAIEGRSRKPQIRLAEEFGIKDYPTPAGGCLLTDPHFARRTKDSFEYKEDSLKEITLLKFGRHFRLDSGAKVIVGRNDRENRALLALRIPSSLCLEVPAIPSPITLLLNTEAETDIKTAASICLKYSDCEKEEGMINYWRKSEEISKLKAAKIEKKQIEKIRI